MKDKPRNIILEGFFIQEGVDNKELKYKDDLLHQKDNLIEQHKKKRKREKEARSGAWKGVIDNILKEKADMKTPFEAQIRKLKRKLQHGG